MTSSSRSARNSPASRSSPPALITGHDLIALGWKPGPQFKETLETIQTLQLERTLKLREDALAWIAAGKAVGGEGAEPLA
jgi:poly(A) polymerase